MPDRRSEAFIENTWKILGINAASKVSYFKDGAPLRHKTLHDNFRRKVIAILHSIRQNLPQDKSKPFGVAEERFGGV
ncbi:hypothetical protein D3C86_1955320 [compost metagenome]